MTTKDEQYAEFIEYLNTRDGKLPTRQKHRLPIECYTASDSEFFFTICARHQGEPFTDADLANAIVEALLWRKRQQE